LSVYTKYCQCALEPYRASISRRAKISSFQYAASGGWMYGGAVQFQSFDVQSTKKTSRWTRSL